MAYRRIGCLKERESDNDNRITVVLATGESYSINQRTLARYETAEELKAALDKWTQQNLGYVLADIWFHKNADGTWATATGDAPPDVWPESQEDY